MDLAKLDLEDDPNIRKYTEELEHVGCRQLGDFRMLPGPTGMSYVRIFALAETGAFVLLNLMFATEKLEKFPARPSFLLVTYFDDMRLVSLNEGGSYRKSTAAHVRTSLFPGVSDPATLIEGHRSIVTEEMYQGHVVTPAFGVAGLVKRLSREHEEVSAALRKRGYYSWPAAIRQNFKLVRQELLADCRRAPKSLPVKS